MNQDAFIVTPGSKISLRKDYDPAYQDGYHEKAEAAQKLQANIQQLAQYQDILYAQNTYAVLIIFQAMDAAGKDSTIKHVMSGVNPQGFQVFSFKAPSDEELDHDYLWRSSKSLPERGRIGIFNRSYYEELLVVRVHPEILNKQQLPHNHKENQIWKQRFEEINNFEKYLVNNGVIILKFFLNVSKSEQKRRFLERIKYPEKNWKFSVNDVRERAFWDDYMQAYEEVFQHTSTDWAPWYIVPADRKWFTRLVVADIICAKLKQLNLKYPTVSEEHRQELLKAKYILEKEA
ncbi:Polyphosphate:AMP phosphotransferase [Trichormus variabilis ATCC 29413]|uniref:Polyphosphate:AMP phosphotransferase n=2 Tax=Anabaena variabilis TaxID=264691 RepID=Q3M8E5_TRIV2|nr:MULTISPECIES: polyphosphate kinase 2 family protein [Nostocaceae]ABA22741.1 Polyphosphate:AMP phosphotransferase [Trichormus variabilis ATCC 29413]MBC1215247.1 polyphosphate kinase 2 family protein [Trichormus variabilis ARAD]MBC1267156.1 polyphosphate kinase 2 family protein [Trichormus variabilis FSR]MBC1303840.1 polyphosphate kinase 2 family protein [Trichormus variabilis N2B]MBC1312272.1 polyphosphate kinase 2 family protein [Trichormus variabilis PNB]